MLTPKLKHRRWGSRIQGFIKIRRYFFIIGERGFIASLDKPSTVIVVPKIGSSIQNVYAAWG
jgi:hypothetical protein